jgi:hypothetical protein
VESRDLKEVQNEYILRLVCFQSVVRASCSRPRRQRDRAAVAPARGPAVRSISARAALHAWPRPKMAREVRAERKLIESSGISSEVETVAEPWTGPRSMISTQPSTHITRAFMAAETGKRIFLLLSAAISCSLAVVALATAQSPPVPPVTSQTDVTAIAVGATRTYTCAISLRALPPN